MNDSPINKAKIPNLLLGTTVKIIDTNSFGEIIEGPNRKNDYCVLIGELKMWVAANRLTPIPTHSKKKKRTSSNIQITSVNASLISVDLHGLTVAEAIEKVEKAIDRGIRCNADRIEIVHGIGSGKLKAAVRDYLTQSPHINNAIADSTNPGVTWAIL